MPKFTEIASLLWSKVVKPRPPALKGVFTGSPKGAPVTVILDEMGYYSPSKSLTSHIAVIGSTGVGVSIISEILEQKERDAPKLVTVSGDDFLMGVWLELPMPSWKSSWLSWMPKLMAIDIVDQCEAGMVLRVAAPLTCEELGKGLSTQYPTLKVCISTEDF